MTYFQVANIIDKIPNGYKKIAIDNNEYLIQLYQFLLNGYVPKDFISREEYYLIKENKHLYDKETVALCGILASYNGNWFRAYGGYSATKTGKDRNFYDEGLRGLMKQLVNLRDVEFIHSDYSTIEYNKDSIIYFDKPYVNTDKSYKDKSFNHDEFWEFVRRLSKDGYTIFVSEYYAPDDFECVWSKEVVKTHPNQKKNSVEKLFKFKG